MSVSVCAGRQRFLLSGSYDLPFGQGRRWSSSSRYIDRVFGDWALNTITLLETGPYLTPTVSCSFDQTNTAPFLSGSVCRPDRVGNPSSGNQPGKQFNLDAFQPTPAGAARVGNAGVGILEGPGTIAVNAGLSNWRCSSICLISPSIGIFISAQTLFER
jgi:hypothetical protein